MKQLCTYILNLLDIFSLKESTVHEKKEDAGSDS